MPRWNVGGFYTLGAMAPLQGATHGSTVGMATSGPCWHPPVHLCLLLSAERKIFDQNTGTMPSLSQAGTDQMGEHGETRGLFHPVCPQRCLLAQGSSV